MSRVGNGAVPSNMSSPRKGFRLARRVHGLQERVGLAGESLDQPRVHRSAKQKRVGGTIVVTSVQVGFSDAHLVPRGSALFG